MLIPNIEMILAFFRLNFLRSTLTIAAIRDNPWNVLSYRLPEDADDLMLEAARLAVVCCGDSEYLFMRAARDGRYVPKWWDATGKTPDVHEESEELLYFADCKLEEIDDRRKEPHQ